MQIITVSTCLLHFLLPHNYAFVCREGNIINTILWNRKITHTFLILAGTLMLGFTLHVETQFTRRCATFKKFSSTPKLFAGMPVGAYQLKKGADNIQNCRIS